MRWLGFVLWAILLSTSSPIAVLSAQTAKPDSTKAKPALSPYRPTKPSDIPSGPAWFIDVAPQAGLRMENINGGTDTKKYIIETTGSGVAIFDYDNDGWPDIFLVNGTTLDTTLEQRLKPSSHLFHNNHDGTFTDVTRGSGLELSGWGQGVCVGDYDNDGFEDLYVTSYGKNHLYRNQGGGKFKDVAEEAGVAGDGSAWGTGCAFVDYDRDGMLDLMVANYVKFDVKTVPKPGEGQICVWKGTPVMCGPRGLPSSPNILYHNLGNRKFEDVSKASGIEKTDGHFCFSVSTLDYDDDGWPDIYVACDSTPSILYHNLKNGTFVDVAAEAGVAFNEDGREQAGMGSTVGDYDGDGRPDIFKTNFSDDSSSLYRNNGDGTFASTIFDAGLGLNTHYLGWGTMFLDVDNDGRLDILSVNGHVYPEVDTAHLGSTYRQSRLLYWNAGNGKFKDLSQQCGPGCTLPVSSRGLAVGDLWNDGRMSAVINNMSGQPMLLVNQSNNQNYWLGVLVRGTKSNRDGIGAKVSVHVVDHKFVQEVRSGSSYISNNDMRLHFGLGSTRTIERIEVRWPTGNSETFAGGPADRLVTVTEGSGTPLRDLPSH